MNQGTDRSMQMEGYELREEDMEWCSNAQDTDKYTQTLVVILPFFVVAENQL